MERNKTNYHFLSIPYLLLRQVFPVSLFIFVDHHLRIRNRLVGCEQCERVYRVEEEMLHATGVGRLIITIQSERGSGGGGGRRRG